MTQGLKLKLPEHVPFRYVWPVLGFLFGIQMLEGTTLVTSLAYCGFIVLMTDAFNACGGLIYPSGSFVFFLALQTLILGGMAKAVLGEPLDSNLINARQSILVYLAGACSVWAAAKISAAFRLKRPLLLKTQVTSNLDQTAIGAALIGFFGAYLVPVVYRSSFNQANQFVSLSLLLAVYSSTKKSGGRKSSSLFATSLWCGLTLWGVVVFSKTGIFMPSLVWALGATLGGYRLSMRRALFAGVLFGSMALFLTPISQMGRIYRDRPDVVEIAADMLMHPVRTRELYEQQQEMDKALLGYHWFDHGEGLLDRLTMIPIDDALIRRTDRGYSPGSLPLETYAINMIPRYLVSSKLTWRWGNRYGHEIGLLGPKDNTTGISFSPFADAYHCLQWWGVTVVSFPLYLGMFWFCDSLTGSTRDTLWATLYILFFSHFAPEGMMNTPFYAVSFIAFMVTFVALTSRYVLPIIGSFVIPVPRVQRARVSLVVNRPRRAPLLPSVPRTIEEKL